MYTRALLSLALLLSLAPAAAHAGRARPGAGAPAARTDAAFAAAKARLDRLEGRSGLLGFQNVLDVKHDLDDAIQSGAAKAVPRELNRRLAKLATRSVERWLDAARKDGKIVPSHSMNAEEAGQLFELARSLEPSASKPTAALRELRPAIHALVNDVIDARVAELTRLSQQARSGSAATAIFHAERQAIALDMDLGRLTRFGFAARTIDSKALLDEVKSGAPKP